MAHCAFVVLLHAIRELHNNLLVKSQTTANRHDCVHLCVRSLANTTGIRAEDGILCAHNNYVLFSVLSIDDINLNVADATPHAAISTPVHMCCEVHAALHCILWLNGS